MAQCANSCVGFRVCVCVCLRNLLVWSWRCAGQKSPSLRVSCAGIFQQLYGPLSIHIRVCVYGTQLPATCVCVHSTAYNLYVCTEVRTVGILFISIQASWWCNICLKLACMCFFTGSASSEDDDVGNRSDKRCLFMSTMSSAAIFVIMFTTHGIGRQCLEGASRERRMCGCVHACAIFANMI